MRKCKSWNSFFVFFPAFILSSCTAEKGEGTAYLASSLFIFFPLLIAIGVVLVRNELNRQKRLKADKKGFDLKRFRIIITLPTLIFVSFLIVNFLPIHHEKNNTESFIQDVHAKDHKSALNYYRLEFLGKDQKTKEFLDLAYKFSQNDNLPEWNLLSFDIEILEKETQSENKYLRIGASWMMSKNDYYLYQVIPRLPENGYGVNFLKGNTRKRLCIGGNQRIGKYLLSLKQVQRISKTN
jgi:hypothetical protein